MPESHRRVGCRADQFRICDAPHTRYWDDGVPVLISTTSGNVVKKSIREYTLTCPLCSDEDNVELGRYDHDEEPVCPECGLLLAGDGVPRTSDGSRLLSDAKAAGRVSPDNP